MSTSEIEEQRQRSVLRERFLDVIEFMENRPIEIATYQGARVTANFRSVDYDILNFHVDSLQTPIGCIPEALIRASDIVTIKFQAV